MNGGYEKRNNEGFSLVEVLVCIAIIVIICIPLSAGFRSSSVLNNRAHHTQAATTYAQETVEEIKRLTLAEYIKQIENAVDGDGKPCGSVSKSVNESLRAKFPGYEEEFFQTITCKKNKIKIGGRDYDLETIFDPEPYSAYFAGGTGTAADVNVFAAADVNNVDGMKFPVITNEINKYEGTGDTTAAYLNDLWWLLTEDERAGNSLENLYNRTIKEVEIIISDEGSNAVRVVCDVTYKASGYTAEKTYNVYNSSFFLETVRDTDGNLLDYEAGGKIYVFAKAYRNQGGGMTGPIEENTIKITNKHSGEPLEIYLVRGYYSTGAPENPDAVKSGMNFDRVILSDGTADKVYSSLAAGEVLTGEVPADPAAGGFSNMNFHTNIKGKNLGRELTATDMEQTIGKDVAKLRCYQLTVTLTESETGKTAAHIVTTKEY